MAKIKIKAVRISDKQNKIIESLNLNFSEWCLKHFDEDFGEKSKLKAWIKQTKEELEKREKLLKQIESTEKTQVDEEQQKTSQIKKANDETLKNRISGTAELLHSQMEMDIDEAKATATKFYEQTKYNSPIKFAESIGFKSKSDDGEKQEKPKEEFSEKKAKVIKKINDEKKKKRYSETAKQMIENYEIKKDEAEKQSTKFYEQQKYGSIFTFLESQGFKLKVSPPQTPSPKQAQLNKNKNQDEYTRPNA